MEDYSKYRDFATFLSLTINLKCEQRFSEFRMIVLILQQRHNARLTISGDCTTKGAIDPMLGANTKTLAGRSDA